MLTTITLFNTWLGVMATSRDLFKQITGWQHWGYVGHTIRGFYLTGWAFLMMMIGIIRLGVTFGLQYRPATLHDMVIITYPLATLLYGSFVWMLIVILGYMRMKENNLGGMWVVAWPCTVGLIAYMIYIFTPHLPALALALTGLHM